MSERPFAAEVGFYDRYGSSAITHPGAVRKYNEDAYTSCPEIGLWAVADGVGGHEAGDVASQIVTDTLRGVPAGLSAAELLAEVYLRLGNAHQRLQKEAAARGPDAIIATTVVVLLMREDHYACLWAGDSRAYLLRDGEIVQVTRDHSLVQELIDANAISPAEAENHPRANVITRAVGSGDSLMLDKVSDRVHDGDRFLLCSDGLWKTMPDEELAALLKANRSVLAEDLLGAALDRNADDNVTVVTVEVSPEMTPFLGAAEGTDR